MIEDAEFAFCARCNIAICPDNVFCDACAEEVQDASNQVAAARQAAMRTANEAKEVVAQAVIHGESEMAAAQSLASRAEAAADHRVTQAARLAQTSDAACERRISDLRHEMRHHENI